MDQSIECPECFSTNTIVREEKHTLVCKECGTITPLDQLKK